jgi:prepilin-type N-terminal cleavage/methylation domain-containing protein
MKRTKLFNSQKGYTIIELLAVMIILSAIGSVIVGVISSTLRGSNKTNSVNQIRQEGNNRLSGIAKMVEYARSFDGISADGDVYKADCTSEPVGALTPTPEPERYYYLKVTNFTNDQLIFSCTSLPAQDEQILASNSASLIDQQSLSVTDCYFTCTQNFLAQPPIIGIYFVLSKKNSTSAIDQETSVPFEINISMRNLGR